MRLETAGRRHGHRGFALVSAIFLLVVLTALGAALAALFVNQQATSAADIQGSRAYWAARAAAEYGLMQVLEPEDATGPAAFAVCPALPQVVNLPGVTGFAVSITHCTRNPAAGHYTDAGLNLVVYSVTAFATAGAVGDASHVEREVTVTAAKCRDPAVDPAVDPRYRCL
jgi:MSHA biogenesis protein MshP